MGCFRSRFTERPAERVGASTVLGLKLGADGKLFPSKTLLEVYVT